MPLDCTLPQSKVSAFSYVLKSPLQGERRVIGVEVAGIGGTHKRLLSILVLVPSCLPRKVVSDIDGEVCQRLLIVVLKRSEGLQNVVNSRPLNQR